MGYTINGKLSGYLCDDCWEWLDGVAVRFYPAVGDQVVARAAADAKDTLAILDEPRAGAPLGEATVDVDGGFIVDLGESYQGEALDVDLYCATLPHAKVPHKGPGPVTLHLTTLQPRWRPAKDATEEATTDSDGAQVAAFEYAVARRYWCLVRARLSGWTLCGHITACGTKDPVIGVTVSAFDVDWLQDDPLGSAVTDTSGHYRIDYTLDDFTRTPFSPWINLELVPGPDVYFRIEAGGSPVLVEDRSTGRTPGRQNIGPCACIDLCIDGAVPPSTIPTIPMFTKVGGYSIKPADGQFAGDGTTTAGSLAFTGDIALNGILPDPFSPDAVEYRFLVSENGGAATPVTAAQIEPTIIGQLQYWEWDPTVFPSGGWRSGWADFYVNNPGATVSIPQPGAAALTVSVNAEVAVDGWIVVPHHDGLQFGGPGRFTRNAEAMAILKTASYTDEVFDLRGPGAGLPVEAGITVPGPERSTKPTYSIQFEARKVVVHTPVGSDTLAKIAFSNMTDTYIRHPYWAGGLVTAGVGVASLGIAEMVASGGCSELGDKLHVLYTSYHPYSGPPDISIEGNPILPPDLTPAVVAGEALSAPGGDEIDISLLAKCAYILWIRVPLRLTSGSGSLGWQMEDHIAFCKQ